LECTYELWWPGGQPPSRRSRLYAEDGDDELPPKRRYQPTRPQISCHDSGVGTVNKQTNKQTPGPLVRKRTIPTDRPPLVDEI
jgi:hypothetical protein